MDRNNSLINFNSNLIAQIGRNLSLVDKLLNTSKLEVWWQSIDENWKKIFKNAVDFDTQPNENQLIQIINLKEFYCVQAMINDLEPLRPFTSLNKLDLMGCKNIDNIESICNCKDLKSLRLLNTKVDNIEVVNEMNGLEELYLSDYVSSLEPIKNLINLKKLVFRKSYAINSLGSLSKLANIEDLVISDKIYDLSPIDGLQKLKRLVCFGVGELEANRFKAIHPETEVIFGEKERVKNETLVEKIRKMAIRIEEDGLNEDEKKLFGL